MRPIERALAYLLLMATGQGAASGAENLALERLKEGQVAHGFRAAAVYLDDADRPMGARFVHARSGFVLDVLQIESVPQAFTYVRTTPVSDQGEPHTQEHLLLGKGTVGRAFASLDTMWLVNSSAFTSQRRTCYHFNTAAGPDVFFDLFERQMDALLHPNYTDEEIRREVRNFGVTKGPDGALRLEEKGTVYNEMVSSMTSPVRALYRSLNQTIYGVGHPLALNSGGEPSGIRTMKPEEIRSFHEAHYFLANMGTIVALPHSVGLDAALARFEAMLARAEPKPMGTRPADTLPAPKPAPLATIAYTEYPHRNDRQPSPLALCWPANRTLDPDDTLLLNLFLSTFAGDPTTNLYKMFIDSKTRKLDIGARTVAAYVDDDPKGGHPVLVQFSDVEPSHFNDEKIAAVRQLIVDELARIAAFGDGSPELDEFNERVRSNLIQDRREYVKYVDSPPGFGARGTGTGWIDHLTALEDAPGFRKSITLKPAFASARARLDTKKNFWREALARWQILGVVPYGIAARPSPALVATDDKERVERAEREAQRLAEAYGLADTQKTIERYKGEYDAASAAIEKEAAQVKPPELVKALPMTPDDTLKYETRKIEGDVPLLAAHFDNMSSGTVGLALRLDGLPRELVRYVWLLPAMLSRVGVIEDGKPISYEEMTQRQRREILSLNASSSTNLRAKNVELVVRGAGLGADEVRRAIHWMSLILHSPDWRPENLPRIQDVVDQALSGVRNTTQGREEAWVQNPPTAYRYQRQPIFFAAYSFASATHDALRVRWLLKDAAGADAAALDSWLTALASAAKGASRDDLKKKIAAAETTAGLPDSARVLASDALKDLDLALIDIPDETLAADWEYLCTAIRDDLKTPAATALAGFDAVRRHILKTGHARLFLTASTTLDKDVSPAVAALAAGLERAPLTPDAGESAPIVDTRLREREPAAERPVHLGLFVPTKPSGVISTSVPGPSLADFKDREKVLDYLASRVYAGAGAHGVFLKTAGSGLAYSNGLGASLSLARLSYYAERTPELPQTVRFVIEELKKALPPTVRVADYAAVQAFAENRASGSYEGRGEAMAQDLAENRPPELIRSFRQAILDLRKEPDLDAKLVARKDRVYARVLPGYDPNAPAVEDAVYFVLGPEKQLAAWEAYLKEVGGPSAKLYRLYGRDYWMPH
jgi:Zn-dependent M16 (insulinase) family peptidase